MKQANVIALAVIIQLVLYGVGPLVHAQSVESMDIADRGNDASWQEWQPKSNRCGVNAVYVVLRECDVGVDDEKRLKRMPPRVYGNSMQQIVDYLQDDTDLAINPIRCDASMLRAELNGKSNQRAIIHLNDHWVVARRLIS